MIALDTNILARFLLNDTPAQAAIAAQLLHGTERCTAPITVFLELVWVLESHGCRRAEIALAIRALCGLNNFVPQNLDALAQAIQAYEAGMDFADALHLALSANASAFKTFDQSFVKTARKLRAAPEVSLP